jgi:hypothetical protein
MVSKRWTWREKGRVTVRSFVFSFVRSFVFSFVRSFVRGHSGVNRMTIERQKKCWRGEEEQNQRTDKEKSSWSQSGLEILNGGFEIPTFWTCSCLPLEFPVHKPIGESSFIFFGPGHMSLRIELPHVVKVRPFFQMSELENLPHIFFLQRLSSLIFQPKDAKHTWWLCR